MRERSRSSLSRCDHTTFRSKQWRSEQQHGREREAGVLQQLVEGKFALVQLESDQLLVVRGSLLFASSCNPHFALRTPPSIRSLLSATNSRDPFTRTSIFAAGRLGKEPRRATPSGQRACGSPEDCPYRRSHGRCTGNSPGSDRATPARSVRNLRRLPRQTCSRGRRCL